MFAAIVNTFANCFKIPELKSRILFTLVVLAICRLVGDRAHSRPGRRGAGGIFCQPSSAAAADCWACTACSPAARWRIAPSVRLGIMPYISATIIIQLLTAVMPHVEQAGARGRRAGQDHPVWPLSDGDAVPGAGLGDGDWAGKIRRRFSARVSGPAGALFADGYIWWYRIQTVLMLTTGTMLLMWLGEQITDRGIGNGVSLVITIGILARLPARCMALHGHVLPGGGAGGQVQHLATASRCCCCWRGDRRCHRHYPGAAKDSRPIRPAGSRAQGVFRRHFVHAVAGELCGRHADHFRPGHPDVPAEDLPDSSGSSFRHASSFDEIAAQLADGRVSVHRYLRR